MATLYRASLEIGATNGRTLEGLALKWATPALVRDLTGPAYWEEFVAQSVDRTLAQRSEPFPVFKRHDYTKDPVGVVTFQRSHEGLIFAAPLSKTRDGDEALELVNDGAMSDVSVGFRPLRALARMAPQGRVTSRQEIALRELSLAPTGFGQVPDAKVHAVRSEGEATMRTAEDLRRRLALLVRR